MREHPRMRGDKQFWLTRGQLAALGLTSVSLSILTFFLGVQVSRLRAPEAPTAVVEEGLISADVESDALTDLLARVEEAAAAELPEAHAAQLSFPQRLIAEEPVVTVPELDPEAADGLGELIGLPPAAPPEVPEPSEVSVPDEGWAVQLWSFPSAEEADAKLALLEEAGHDAFRVEALVKGETWYRVRVGPYANKDRALDAMPELAAEQGVDDPIVTPVR